MKIRRETGKRKKKSYTIGLIGESGGRKTVQRTEKDGGRQRRMEAVKPVGGLASMQAEHQEDHTELLLNA